MSRILKKWKYIARKKEMAKGHLKGNFFKSQKMRTQKLEKKNKKAEKQKQKK